MAYSNSQAFYDEVLSKFLYGQASTPNNLIDDAIIRPDGVKNQTVEVSVDDYMSEDGAGRFALPSLFPAIQAFFEASDAELGITGSGSLTFSQLEQQLSLTASDWRIAFNQGFFDDGKDDYAYRTFFWSSVAYEIADTAQFVVHTDGTRSIEGLIVKPRDDDNFDWQGATLAEYLNPIVRPLIDPFNIGGDGTPQVDRTVTIKFTGSASAISYSYQDYLDDKLDGVTTVSGRNPSLSSIAMDAADYAAAITKLGIAGVPFVQDLYNRGVIKYDQDGYDVMFGTNADDEISYQDAWAYRLIAPGFPRSQAAILGGKGNDIITGSSGSDLIYGGENNDTLYGGDGADEIWGGGDGEETADGIDTADYSDDAKPVTISVSSYNGLTVRDGSGAMDQLHAIDVVKGTVGRDRVVIEGTISTETDQLTINANGGQGPSPEDTIDLSRSDSRNTIYIDEFGNGAINDLDTGGYINLEGFHTNLMGSNNDDTITDHASGPKRISANGGNDTITITGGPAYVDGGSGDDTITGGVYNDILVGGEGENELIGGDGADRLFASANNNILDGGDGDDMLVISKDIETARIVGGAGNDVIDARANRARDYWRAFDFPSLPSAEEGVYLSFRSGDGHDVLLGNGYDNPTPGIELHTHLNLLTPEQEVGLGWGIDAIVFEDLSIEEVTFVWDITSVASQFDPDEGNSQADTYVVAAGNLAIVVNSTGDSIYLGNIVGSLAAPDEQNLTIWGYDNNDVYREVIQFYKASLPAIYFNDGQLVLGGDGPGSNAYWMIGDVSQYNTALNDHSTATAGSNGGEVEGTSGNDNLEGGSGNDSVSGGTGNDDYQASGGDDVFDGGDGDDTLTVFGQISGFDFQWQEDGSVLAESHSGLEGKTKLIDVEQVYSIADDQSYAIGDLAGEFGTNGNDSLISGTSRNDHLFGLAGNDTLLGGAGDDLINGGDGTDTARYAGNSADYMVYLNETGALTVKDLTGTDGSDELVDIENIEFVADAVTIAATAIPPLGTSAADLVEGDARANRLFGLGGNDTLDGGAGNDILEGGSGDDTYLISSGDGNDVIVEGTIQDVNHDVLDLSWLDPEDVVLTRAGGINDAGDLLIRVVSTGDVIRVVGQFSDPYWDTNGIEEILFGNSVTWDREAIKDNANLVGTSGNDALYGTDYSATIEGKGGDDTIYGFWGADAILFGANDGHDTFVGIQNGATLKLVGLDSGDVTMERDGSNLIVTVISTGATMTVVDQFPAGGYGYGLGAIEFATGGTFSIDQLVGDIFSPPINGTSGNDAIWGTMLQDVINGGDGDDELYSVGYALPDTLNGGAGNDQLYGHDLDDVLNGGDDDDLLSGSYGDDALDGGAGTDRLIGGVGNDLLVGGSGSADVAVYEGLQSSFGIATVNGTVTINDNAPSANGDEGTDSLSGIEIVEFQGGIQAGISSPIILDLNGNGVTLVDNKRTKVGFDWDGDGVKNQTGWIGKDDGFLFIDRDGNGTVTNAGELSFTSDKDGAKSDLDGLRAFDSNGDGIFSSADDQFSQFKVWRDENGNGRVDKKEILSLQKAGVASIELAGEAVNQSWEWGENITVNTGSFTRTNGTIGSFSDVALSYDAGNPQNAAINKAASHFSEAIAGFSKGSGTFELGKLDAWVERRDHLLAVAGAEWR